MITTLKQQKLIKESLDNLSDDITMLKSDTLEPIDPKVQEIDKIIDVISDKDEIKKLENAGTNVSTDLTIKTVNNGDILQLTALLKPRNKSTAYPLGEMGCIKVKVLQTFYSLNKINNLKKQGKL